MRTLLRREIAKEGACGSWEPKGFSRRAEVGEMRGQRKRKRKRKDPPKRVLFASLGLRVALLLTLFSRHRVFEEILVLRCEAFRETENLKAVAIADGPELDVG